VPVVDTALVVTTAVVTGGGTAQLAVDRFAPTVLEQADAQICPVDVLVVAET